MKKGIRIAGTEISQTFDVLQRIRKGEKMVAIIAPSILGQFKTSIGQVYGAFKEIGFTDVIEVAEGAMSTTSNEAHELLEKLEEGQKLSLIHILTVESASAPKNITFTNFLFITT